jgi:uncharacterized protein (PEP-CTERM system associated)
MMPERAVFGRFDSLGRPRRLRTFLIFAVGTAGWFGSVEKAHAFPLTDALTPSILTPTLDAQGEPTDLTSQIGPAGPFSGLPSPGWTFTPRAGIQTSYNDNVLATHSDHRWDWVNYFTAGLTVQGNTDRVTARFDYAPTMAIYARTPSLNYLSQNFTGNGSITFVPDLFYMDVRGLAGVQPRNGTGFGASGVGSAGATTGLPPNQLSQVATVGITPYLLHRFGEYGTGKIGYSFNGSTQSAVNGFGSLPFIGSSGSSSQAVSSLSPAQQQQLNQSGFLGSGILNQNSTQITNQEVAQFQTGEFLGRFNNLSIISASQYSGSGGTSNGYQNFISNQLGYALTRQITVFASIGYEDISYDGTPGTKINDATWQVGTTLIPNADSKITFGYGHQSGVDSFQANGSYQVTPRLGVSVAYNTGIGNGLSQLQNNVAVSDVNQNGYLVNAITGAPLFNLSGTIGNNNNLYRTRTLSASAQLVYERDVIVASYSMSDQELLGTTQQNGAAFAANTTSNTAYGSWTHQISPAWSSIASGSYTTQPSQAAQVPGTQSTVNANLTLQYQINPTLTASAQYAYYDRSSPFTFLSFTQNVFLLGIMKTF